MPFFADLHLHSPFSWATARNMDIIQLYIAAQLKGLTVLGSGDILHGGWRSQVAESLVATEGGLYQLRPTLAASGKISVPATCQRPVYFMLTAEVSNVYLKNGRRRKNHNLLLLPDLNAAERLSRQLAPCGNLETDGRPTLNLDTRELLARLLDTVPEALLIPAHIWTPWFSLYGARSGFDSLLECFEDLAPWVFAVETGLSSDPAMNRLVPELDQRTLVSNSDAHGPSRLGRQANCLNTELTYTCIINAIKSGNPQHFWGTVEYFPQEGKYYLDGHRKCGISLAPEVTRRHKGRCPHCGGLLTIGVLHRIQELGDPSRSIHAPPAGPTVSHIIPLTELLALLLGCSPHTKKVQRLYHHLLTTLGPELPVLLQLPPEQLNLAQRPHLTQAILDVRAGHLTIEPGYDGCFGRVRLNRELKLGE